MEGSISSPHKQMKKTRKSSANIVHANSSTSNYMNGGMLLGPPPASSLAYYSLPPTDLASLYHQRRHHHQQQQPPILPLPISNPYMYSYVPIPSRIQKPTRTRDPPKQPVKREEPNNQSTRVKALTRSVSLRPGHNVMPAGVMDDLNKFSGPPPSSLPLPKFSLRIQRSCKAEASGVDSGATDNLRQLLRLR